MKKIIIPLFILTFSMSDEVTFFSSTAKINYKEYMNSQIMDEEQSDFGDITGFKLGYKIDNDRFFFLVNFKYLLGNTYYSGVDWNKNKIYAKENGVYISQITFRSGYNLISNEMGNFNLIGGLGYRFYNRGKSDKAGDYDEQYKFKFYEIGASINKKIDNIFTGVRFLYHRAVNPQLEAYFENRVTYNLGKTDGYSITIPLGYQFNKNWSFISQYEYQYWKSNKSGVIYVNKIPTHEPDSETKNSYLNIGFRYSF